MADAQKPVHPSASRWQRLYQWLDLRTGLGSLMHEALDEPIPGGARWAYVFGSVLLFLFISQTITGIFLALYYVPSADRAHTTVAYIVKEVTGGSFLRSLHAYGSSAVVIVVLLHLTQTYLYGAYKGRRELLWISGCVLFALMLAMAFTGYLVAVGSESVFCHDRRNEHGDRCAVYRTAETSYARRQRNGNAHRVAFFCRACFSASGGAHRFIAAHVYLFRKAGAAGPPSEDPIIPKLPTQRFYPRQVLMDTVVALLMILLARLARTFSRPPDLGPKANPADTQYVPRPEWYYLPIFQWLKYFEGRSRFSESSSFRRSPRSGFAFHFSIGVWNGARGGGRSLLGIFLIILGDAHHFWDCEHTRRSARSGDRETGRQTAAKKPNNSCANRSNRKRPRARFPRPQLLWLDPLAAAGKKIYRRRILRCMPRRKWSRDKCRAQTVRRDRPEIARGII